MKVEFFREIICARHKRVAPTCPDCQVRHYKIDGQREANGLPIESVTTILKEIGDQFRVAAWWGMTVGVEGTLRLVREQEFDPMCDEPASWVADLTRHKLTVNHVRDSAADRGTNVHADAENWADTGELPPPDNGWRQALRTFIKIEQPEPLGSEVLVGSREHAYAGTFDLLARFPKLHSVGVIDYKSKTKPPKGKPAAYPQHHLQLRGYEDARVEMGHEPSDFQAVVNLYPDGTYALIQGQATSDQWQDTLSFYRSFSALKGLIKGLPVGVAA